jgi:alpha-glucoside transport system permease protein
MGTIGLLAVPLQVALIPLLQMFVGGAHLTLPLFDKTITVVPDLNLVNTTTAVWITHAGFAMPFAVFLFHSYISNLPRDLLEAARIDGAGHFDIFWRLVFPLSVPVFAAFGTFQFLWTWNDYLIANTFAGTNPDARPTTIIIANLAGTFGQNEHLLPAAGFVQAFFPLVVFFALQRYFIRGILAGSVKQ